MVVTTAQMYEDRYKLRCLDREMNLLGDKIIRLENMRDRHDSKTGKDLCNKRIQEAADEQDVINEKLCDLLSKYTVTYSGTGSFTVSSGDKHYTVHCKDGEIMTMTKIIINR